MHAPCTWLRQILAPSAGETLTQSHKSDVGEREGRQRPTVNCRETLMRTTAANALSSWACGLQSRGQGFSSAAV